MPGPSRIRIDQAPLAFTSDAQLAVGLGYTHDLRTIEQVIELLRDGAFSGELFVGVVLTGTKEKAALKKIDDAAAEIASTSGVRRPRSRRR